MLRKAVLSQHGVVLIVPGVDDGRLGSELAERRREDLTTPPGGVYGLPD
jgi:hypothetical protein